MDNEKLLTVTELAKALSVTPQTIVKWQKTKLLPGIRMGDKCTRYSWPMILEWAKEQDAKTREAQANG